MIFVFLCLSVALLAPFGHCGLRSSVAFSGKVSPTSDLLVPLHHLLRSAVVFSYST